MLLDTFFARFAAGADVLRHSANGNTTLFESSLAERLEGPRLIRSEGPQRMRNSLSSWGSTIDGQEGILYGTLRLEGNVPLTH